MVGELVECPSCSGEGHDFEVIIESPNPCVIICELCDGSGLIEQPILCEDCNYLISGLDLDYSEYEDIVEYERCENCNKLPHIALDIVSVQPMTQPLGKIFYASAGSSAATSVPQTISNNTWQWT